MWGESKARRALVIASIPALVVFGGVGGATAQPIFQPTFSDSQLCVTADFGNALLQGPIQYSKVVPVDLPAGEVVIPEAISFDGYAGRSTIPTQLSERWEVEFLDADGNVIATSDATPDIADGVERAEYIGALGSVTLNEPAVAVRAHHRTDLPPDPSPNSVYASGVTLCWEEGVTPPACTDDAGNTVEPNSDGTCPSPPEVCLDVNGDPLTNDDGSAIEPNDNGDCPAPATPQCLDPDGNVLEPAADGSCPPAGPLTPQCVGPDGGVLTPNSDGSCPVVPAPPPAGPTVPAPSAPSPSAPAPGAPSPSAPAQPQGQLPVTGSESSILLLSGLWLVAAGGTATLFVRSRMTPAR